MQSYFMSLQTAVETYRIEPWEGLRHILNELSDEENR